MAIDYEAEYNNRARVPEHPQIFERWKRDSAAYREQAAREGRAELRLSYGPHPRNIVDIFFPKSGREQPPVALFVHGGYWRSLEPALFSHMARGLNERGVTAAVAGYNLCPSCTIASIIEQIRQVCLFLWRRFGKRIMVYGHSAGGHLAAAMLATDWKALDPAAPPDLVPAAYSISGLFDLTPMLQVSMNADLRLKESDIRAVSPIFWPVPAGRVFDAVVGGEESSEFLRQSRIIVEAWRQGHAETRYEAVPGKNHFTVVDALTDAKTTMVDRLVHLCARTEKGA
jgi:arylformamidase